MRKMSERISTYFSPPKSETMYQRFLAYANELEPPVDIALPNKNVLWLYPHRHPETRRCMEAFYSKYYSDNHQRILMLGINPGRFGGGTTGSLFHSHRFDQIDRFVCVCVGVPFTDPIRLKTVFQIDANFPMKPELSAQFIHDHFLEKYSHEEFYRHFFIGSVCPLGLESNGRNMNYYDNKALMQQLLEHYIPEHLEKHIQLGCSTKVAICLGEGTNYSVLQKLNEQHHFFDRLLKIAHPRYIMQYKRRMIGDYVQQYIDTCQLARELAEK